MTNLDFFQKNSEIHICKIEENGFSIFPISQTDIDIDNFQKIARQALNYSGKDYLPKEHTSEGKIDTIFFQRCKI